MCSLIFDVSAIATWHPDKFPDDEAKKKEGGLRMEKINRAWYCLGDDDRKKRYVFGKHVVTVQQLFICLLSSVALFRFVSLPTHLNLTATVQI